MGIDDKNMGLCTYADRYFVVNKYAKDEDIKATLDFMLWCIKSPEGTRAMDEDMGYNIPFKNAEATSNVFVNSAMGYIEDAKFSINNILKYLPNDKWKKSFRKLIIKYIEDSSKENWRNIIIRFEKGFYMK